MSILREILPYLAGIAALIGAIAGGWKIFVDGGTARNAGAANFNQALMERLGRVEDRVTTLERELSEEREFSSSAISFIEKIAVLWHLRTEISFPHLPVKLRERVDVSGWQEIIPNPPHPAEDDTTGE